MKKINRFFLLLFIFIIFISNISYGATKESVISAINNTYYVAGEPFRLPDKVIGKAISYLNSHNLTSEQYSSILSAINRAVDLANEVGTTDITKISKSDLKRGLGDRKSVV